MYDVYILYSVTVDRYFVGMTSDFDRAIARHNNGKNKHTKTGIPWNPVYKESFSEITTAQEREREIKQSADREELSVIIQSGKNQIWTFEIYLQSRRFMSTV